MLGQIIRWGSLVSLQVHHLLVLMGRRIHRECLTLKEGPFGLETQVHSDQVVMPMARLVEERSDASAFVIAKPPSRT